MELPPVAVPPGASGTLPPVVTGTVQSILSPNRYAIQVQGLLLELEAQLFLSVGDKVPLRVARQTPKEVVFELVRPPQGAGEEPRDPPRFPPEARELVREFVRMRAPLDPALIGRALQAAADGPARQAAAFLAAHGLEPTAEMVAALARLVDPASTEPPASPAPLLAPLVEALGERTAAAPADVAVTAPLLAGPPTAALEEAVAQVLEGSPRLQMIDRLIEIVGAAAPAEVPAQEVPARLDQALRLVRAATPETLDETARALPQLPKEALRQVLQELHQLERREIASIPELAQARDARGAVLDAAQRMTDVRLVNQLARLRDDGVLALEIPLRADGRLVHVPLRIRREPDKPGSAEAGPRFSVTLDADLSRIGFVRARLDSAGRTLRVRFRVRERGVKSHLERGAGGLAESLKAQGYEASIAAELVSTLERESIFDVFAAPDGEITLDVKL
jgi:hypothetical protein